MTNKMTKRLLPLTLIPILALASCGSSPATPSLQSQSLSNGATAAPAMNLSAPGKEMLQALRSAAGRQLIENDYVNMVANSEMNSSEYERGRNPEVFAAHQWAFNELTSTKGPVSAQWIRAYIIPGKADAVAALDACRADTINQLGCADALNTATHAAATLKANNGAWLIVLANIQGQMKVTPVAVNR